MKATQPTSLARLLAAQESHDHAPNEATKRDADAVVLDEWRKVQRSEEFRVRQALERVEESRGIARDADSALRILDDLSSATGTLSDAEVDRWLGAEAMAAQLVSAMRRAASDHRAMASNLVDPLEILNRLQTKYPSLR